MNTNGLNVLMFGWELPPDNTGGLGVACYGMAKGLSQMGTNISFAMPKKLSTNVNFMHLVDYSLSRVQVTGINSLLSPYMTPSQYQQHYLNQTFSNQQVFASNFYDEAINFSNKASLWCKDIPYQIIHAHDWMTYPAGMKAQQQSGQPFVAHVHATEYDRTGGYVNSQIADVEYQGLNSADHIITVSNYTKDVVHRYYSIPNKNITVVHNGIDPVEFTGNDIKKIFPNDNIVLFVGRLTFQKGVSYLLKAAKTVLKYHPNTVFIIAGDGDQSQQLILESAALGMSQRVIFAGFLSGNNLQSVYRMADVFVMPSVSEPYGIVALEAAASNVPCVISKQSGVSETLQTVYKVDFWDTEALAKNICAVLSYPHLSAHMSQSASAEVKNLSWQNSAKKIYRVYQSLLN